MHDQRSNRAGFTLIELLVVIAIIAILVALTLRGTFQVIESQQVANTEIMMRTVNQTLEKHWAQVIADAKKETNIPDAVRLLAGGDEERTRVIWIKFRLMEAFPTSYSEITTNPLYTNNYIPSNMRKYQAAYLKKLNGKTSANDSTTESAACLLMALSVTRAGAALTESGLGSNAADTDGDGLKEIVDTWGKPLAFYRFPTNNLFLQRSNTTGQAGDPLDSKGKLNDPNWSNRGTFQGLCNYTIADGSGVAYYTSPTLVSAGRNQILGLNTPDMSIADPNGSDDNIYSFRLREGAKGN